MDPPPKPRCSPPRPLSCARAGKEAITSTANNTLSIFMERAASTIVDELKERSVSCFAFRRFRKQHPIWSVSKLKPVDYGCGRTGSPYGDVAVFALDCLPDGKNGHFANLALARARRTCPRRQIRVETDPYFLQLTILVTRSSECRSREPGIRRRELGLNLSGT